MIPVMVLDKYGVAHLFYQFDFNIQCKANVIEMTGFALGEESMCLVDLFEAEAA